MPLAIKQLFVIGMRRKVVTIEHNTVTVQFFLSSSVHGGKCELIDDNRSFCNTEMTDSRELRNVQDKMEKNIMPLIKSLFTTCYSQIDDAVYRKETMMQ